MINRVIRGRGIKGLLNYMTHDKEATTTERAETISSNLTATDVAGMSREFGQLYKIRNAKGKDIPKDAVRHFVLSLAPGEKLKPEQWADVTKEFLEKMGYDKTLHHAVKHSDTDHEHIHIACLRINPANGNLIGTSNEQMKALTACRDIEKKYGLKLASDSKKSYTYETLAYRLSPKLDEFHPAQHWQIKNVHGSLHELTKTFCKDFRDDKFLNENLIYMDQQKDGKQPYLYCKFKNNCSARIYLSTNKITLKGSTEALAQLKDGLKSSFETFKPVAKIENPSNVERRGLLKEKISIMQNNNTSNSKATSSVSKGVGGSKSVWDMVKPSASKPKVELGKGQLEKSQQQPVITSACFTSQPAIKPQNNKDGDIAELHTQIKDLENQMRSLPDTLGNQQKRGFLQAQIHNLKGQARDMQKKELEQIHHLKPTQQLSEKQKEILIEKIRTEAKQIKAKMETLKRQLNATADPKLAEAIQRELSGLGQNLQTLEKAEVMFEAPNQGLAYSPPKPKGPK